MSQSIDYPKFEEKAPDLSVDLEKVRYPQYGRVLEDFKVGEVFCHPRGITITKTSAIDFATGFMQANPLYLNQEYAKAHGFKDLVVSPQMVFNIALSLGVQNDSEKAIANLGYYNVCFVKSVYPGDTLRALTKVLDRQVKEGKPGIVTIRTIALNQKDELVLQYDRKIMVAAAGKESEASTLAGQPFPEAQNLKVELPQEVSSYPKNLTGVRSYFENFKVGDIIVHANGRTITDEHYAWTYKVMNTHPLHYDRLYSTGRSGPMSGEPIVYGGLAFAWLEGLASRDISENALIDLGYTEGYHTQPAISGDTIYAISRVLSTQEEGYGLKAGTLSVQLIGIKNIRPKEALEKYGAELFEKENSKKKLGKEKIPEKIFEIERRLLIKRAN
ncbi:MAG: MaoC family dehydratase N-terminal domain-containing protein [Deltaproteobacteria bacterium]|nr:MaoC family dehydratase N-terminal domain-containing protein [Deltaproteobacteria bacterium]